MRDSGFGSERDSVLEASVIRYWKRTGSDSGSEREAILEAILDEVLEAVLEAGGKRSLKRTGWPTMPDSEVVVF